jgi:hypothetical protein
MGGYNFTSWLKKLNAGLIILTSTAGEIAGPRESDT